MVSDLDIWRTANVLTRQHGPDAGVVAGQRANELLAKGDVEGAAVWKRIARAIDELQRMQPHDGELAN